MKKYAALWYFLIIAATSCAQELTQVTFNGGSTLSFLAFRTDQQIFIRISDEGNLLEWGMDPGPGRYYYDPKKLQPYLGRVEYYGPEYDSLLRGKIKSIGTCSFTYYDKYEIATKAGRLKTIGRVSVDYYDNYEDAAYKGKMKFAGHVQFGYYSSFENEAFRGKLKMIGNNMITYYSTFDDKAIRGKIKSIGSSSFTWYESYDRSHGALKSGNVTQVINGITFSIF